MRPVRAGLADEVRRHLLAHRQTGERYDVRDDDFELALSSFEPPDREADVLERARLRGASRPR